MNRSETYASKERRDTRAKELKALGQTVKKSSMRNQCLHPMYLADERDHIAQEDLGFGNTLYKTMYPAIYTVTW